MNGIIGFLLIGVAIIFFVTFVMGDSLTTKEKIKLALAITTFLIVIAFGVYLLAPYAN